MENVPSSMGIYDRKLVRTYYQNISEVRLEYHRIKRLPCPEDGGVTHADSSDNGSMLAAAVCLPPSDQSVSLPLHWTLLLNTNNIL